MKKNRKKKKKHKEGKINAEEEEQDEDEEEEDEKFLTREKIEEEAKKLIKQISLYEAKLQQRNRPLVARLQRVKTRYRKVLDALKKNNK